jgi:hypothetical protein
MDDPVDDPEDPDDPEDTTTIDVEHLSAGLVKLGKFSYVDVDVEINTLPNLLRSVAGGSTATRLTVDQWVSGIHRAPLLFECWFERTVEWWDRLLWRHSEEECQRQQLSSNTDHHDRRNDDNNPEEFASSSGSPPSHKLKIQEDPDGDEEYPLE